jgi:LDH2 family malate/lactate/ureidoglycolate dehydrogenase
MSEDMIRVIKAGLGLVLGLLAGPLLGAKVGKALGQAVKDGHYDKGDLFIAIDPAAFGNPTVFRAAVDAHLAEVKASKKAPGVETIRVPGERSFAERAHRLCEGVPVENGVWAQIVQLAAQLHVGLPAPDDSGIS